MRRLPPGQPNFAVRRERDHRALARLVLLLFCGLVLSGGFVFAAGQRFSAVRYGYKSEELRRERERLLEEQRRLILAREQATSPARLESAARAIGMQPVRASQVETGAARTESGQSSSTTALAVSSATLNR
ncbi:MAG: cell division protein FtsL [Pyrinomonadaceae bacterium]|nr:cell division protein FtsL [Pyrinomonadaceae bacterium]